MRDHLKAIKISQMPQNDILMPIKQSEFVSFLYLIVIFRGIDLDIVPYQQLLVVLLYSTSLSILLFRGSEKCSNLDEIVAVVCLDTMQ